MSKKRFDRIEGMLSQLIGMVGNMQTVLMEHSQKFEAIDARFNTLESKMDKMESRMDNMESKMDKMESRMDKMEIMNETRHIEVIQHIKRLEKDQDFIWEKAVRNERELEIMKRSTES